MTSQVRNLRCRSIVRLVSRLAYSQEKLCPYNRPKEDANRVGKARPKYAPLSVRVHGDVQESISEACLSLPRHGVLSPCGTPIDQDFYKPFLIHVIILLEQGKTIRYNVYVLPCPSHARQFSPCAGVVRIRRPRVRV